MYWIKYLFISFYKYGTRLLFKANNTITVRYGLKLSSLWHPYVDKTRYNALSVYLQLKGREPITATCLTGTGILQLFTVDKVYHIPCGELSKRSLEKHFRNWQIIQGSAYRAYVDYSVQTYHTPFTYYSTEKLYPISTQELGETVGIFLDKVNQNSVTGIPDMSHLSYATLQIATFCTIDLKPLLTILSTAPLACGFMHGDLTAKNILKNSKGCTVLIDLDRAMLNGLLIFDVLHFTITSLEHKHRKSWVDLLIGYLLYRQYPGIIVKQVGNFTDNQLLFLYFLYRVGYEIHPGVMPPTQYISSLCKLSQIFTHILST
jgi:hypothetical protein